MAAEQKIDVPRQWEQLTLDRLPGLLLIVGAPDMGKSTFAQYLYRRLQSESGNVAYLDGDPGQSRLGPPTTMTVAMSSGGDNSFPPSGWCRRSFVGAVSPRGHMLPLLTGASRLIQAARAAGAETILYDTTGLVDPDQGGTALKLAKIDLLRPTVLFALQRDQELESLLMPLRRSKRLRVVEVSPSPARRPRDVTARRQHRADRFGSYFEGAQPLTVEWTRLAVLPSLHFLSRRLVALEDVDGFTRGLGLVTKFDLKTRQVTLQTPLSSLDGIDTLRLGDVTLEPDSYWDQRLDPRKKH